MTPTHPNVKAPPTVSPRRRTLTEIRTGLAQVPPARRDELRDRYRHLGTDRRAPAALRRYARLAVAELDWTRNGVAA